MFRRFENFVDPFQPTDGTTPPSQLWPYLFSQFKPFQKYMVWMALSGMLVALIESALIFYSGRLIDLMAGAEVGAFWSTHGLELVLAAAFILFLRPIAIALNHLLLEQTLAGNMQEQVRWRSHKHLLGQSSGFFQNDFAGRLSNRVMQMGPAVEDATYMAFEGIWYSVTYVIGALLILSQIDIRIAIPLAIWLV
ncbi:MAG: ABC transporter transmembrane domain-containing protein, partial [Pseudomonadota bacterium]